MKKIYAIVAMSAMIFSGVANAVNIDGIDYNLNSADNTATVTGCDDGITELNIPGTVTDDGVVYTVKEIGGLAFQMAEQLTKVTIGEGVETIGGNAFYWCDSIKELTLPSTLTSIGRMAFYWCDVLEKVTCYAVNPPAAGSDAFEFDTVTTVPIYVPEDSVDAYKAADEWSDFKNYQVIISDGISKVLDTTESAVVRYYNMNGVEISTPENGIFIKVEGNKASKILK